MCYRMWYRVVCYRETAPIHSCAIGMFAIGMFAIGMCVIGTCAIRLYAIEKKQIELCVLSKFGAIYYVRYREIAPIRWCASGIYAIEILAIRRYNDFDVCYRDVGYREVR